MSEGTTCIRSSTATANPTPACPFPYGVTVSPINRPPLSSRAPPAAVSGTFASVWMAPRTVVAHRHRRPRLRDVRVVSGRVATTSAAARADDVHARRPRVDARARRAVCIRAVGGVARAHRQRGFDPRG